MWPWKKKQHKRCECAPIHQAEAARMAASVAAEKQRERECRMWEQLHYSIDKGEDRALFWAHEVPDNFEELMQKYGYEILRRPERFTNSSVSNMWTVKIR